MKNLTPEHMRCEIVACPSVHQLEDGRLLIVGEEALIYFTDGGEGALRYTTQGDVSVGWDEQAVIIDLALLSGIKHLIP